MAARDFSRYRETFIYPLAVRCIFSDPERASGGRAWPLRRSGKLFHTFCLFSPFPGPRCFRTPESPDRLQIRQRGKRFHRGPPRRRQCAPFVGYGQSGTEINDRTEIDGPDATADRSPRLGEGVIGLRNKMLHFMGYCEVYWAGRIGGPGECPIQ